MRVKVVNKTAHGCQQHNMWIIYLDFQSTCMQCTGKFSQSPPIRHLSPFLDQGLSPPPPRQGSSPKNLKNLNTFLCQIWLLLSSKVPLKSVFHAENSKKWPNFALGGQFWLQSYFLQTPPPHLTSSPLGTGRDQKFWVPLPHQKFRKKKTLAVYVNIYTGKLRHRGKCHSGNCHSPQSTAFRPQWQFKFQAHFDK